MITINSKDNTVTCSIDGCNEIGNLTFPFQFVTSNNWSAKLLAANIEKSIENRIEEIRRKAYQDGYKDAKSKAKKKNNFSGSISDCDYIGYAD